MNQILHKAKLKNQDRWVVGFYCNRQETTYCFKEDYERHPVKTFHYIVCDEMTDWGLPNEFRFYEIDPETLCVFTGMTDKNGNKIWENDIVKRVDRRNGLYVFREQPKMNCKVVWSDRHGFDTEPSCGYFDKKNATECEVIGNIFNNPELLA